MFLLSSVLIKRYMQPERSRLKIKDMSEENLYPTCYYFRLGEIATVDGKTQDVKSSGLTIPPAGKARVRSWERFELSDSVLGLLGSRTKLPEEGLQLIYGMCIDPGYDAQLELWLRNVTSETVSVEHGHWIGKVMFFDISDTALEAAQLTDEAKARASLLNSQGGKGRP